MMEKEIRTSIKTVYGMLWDVLALYEKYDEVYLTEWRNIKEARAAIKKYIHRYNFERCHSAIGYITPAEAYFPLMLRTAAKEAA